MKRTLSGFTIVELLIVIVVIGILAAITIVAYNGIQNRSYDTTIQNDISALSKQLKLQKVTSATDSYPYGNPWFNFSLKVNKSAYAISPAVSFNLLVCGNNTSTPSQFAILATSKSGNQFYITDTSSIQSFSGAAWSGGTADIICTTFMTALNGTATNSYGIGAGYSVSDTTTGPWRTWAN